MRKSRPIHEPPEPVPVDPRPSRVETDLATLEIGHGFTLGNPAYPPHSNSEGDRVVYITRPSTVPGCDDVIEYTIHGRGRSGVIRGAAFIAHPAMREIAQRDPQQYGFTPGTWLTNEFHSTMMHIEWESVQPSFRKFRANATEESIHWPYSAALDYATTIYPRRTDEDFFPLYRTFESFERSVYAILERRVTRPVFSLQQAFVIYAMFIGENESAHRMYSTLVRTGNPDATSFSTAIETIFGRLP
ncbi:hypothetical protein [Tsukamurella paurometabola]|uniref:Uncharacterized protein n=1 Tax=Tsukamurella paurometabola TaxID=2061 RepID=A0ABS5NF04_TSUPA|nr:hypothetical protein [Tsukamurella paurometabola]MBS4102849.1 hypothetical protein [Tsukamurella paurometabola]